uniref:PHD-type domain-containing protein n=1 Tax=Globisporangium ultimum (strain ATCC 200006 / CBS 805.95 / DAOM BR144) TaxID=431595 RepID=K3WTS0_GLOUD
MDVADEDVDMQDAGAVPYARMSWDQRRRLAMDIANLSPPDQPGVLLLIHNFHHTHAAHNGNSSSSFTEREFPPPSITQWDVQAHTARQIAANPIQLECECDLDTAMPELLLQLRQYVDNCYIPHYVSKENCCICEGLWSSGRLIVCGNDACDTKIHEECFGVVLRELNDGPWKCPSCLFGRQLMCAVCMQYGGALKPVTMNSIGSSVDEQKWVHTLCAMAIPELVMRDVPSMEPVDGFEEIENGRFRYLCGICRKRGGASIICEQEGCNVGMHPLCAGNAGFMIGSDMNPLAVYCEKHLPVSRIPGAKRLISDEDLVEEIMSENSALDEDIDEKYPAVNETQRYAFITESTPYLYQKSKLLGDRATLKWGTSTTGSSSTLTKRLDLRAKTFAMVRMNQSATLGVKTQRPSVYPPARVDDATGTRLLGIPAFPEPEDLVGAIVDFLVKEKDEWVRAIVLEWDEERKLHLVQLIHANQKLWASLSTSNTLVLYLVGEANILDGPRVKLYRPVKQGEADWRPKPRTFASSAS